MTKPAIFDKKNVLVTGGAGFIGSHLCEELLRSNDSKIICVDNFVTGSEKNIDQLLQNPDFEFIRHDLTQPLNLELFPELAKFRIQFQGVQEIYHLACPTSVKQFESLRIETSLANSLAVKNVLDLAILYRAKLLHASSSVVYGPRRPDIKFFNEDYLGYVDPVSPRACYDEGKRFAETLVNDYRVRYDLDTKIVRLFRIYGSRMKLNDGQMLPDFVTQALDNLDIVIYGDENFSSSFCHISDIVSGIIKVMKSSENGPLNLGSDLDYKLIDVARKVIEETSSKSKIVYHEPLLFLSSLGLPDITSVKEKVGWFPIVLLEDGIRETIDYLKNQKLLLHL